MTTQYLPLTEYSSKYRISISTLRRKIKAEDIRFRFEDGKYLLLDEPMGTHQKVHRPSQGITSEETLMSAHAGAIVRESAPAFNHFTSSYEQQSSQQSVNQLLAELKKAYSQILQEKEEQILILKEEVSDLKTLTKVLESENERMKAFRK